MKRRTKEEAAAVMRAYRARKKAQSTVTPSVIPSVTPPVITDSVTPVIVTPCADCARLRAEAVRLQTRIDALEAQRDTKPLPKDEAEALTKRVIEDKVNRLNNYAKGHNIGKVMI